MTATIDRRIAQRRFEGATSEPLLVSTTVAERLLERLDLLKLRPQRALDAGAGSGQVAVALAKRYPRSQVVGVDFAIGPLLRGKPRWPRRRRWFPVATDIEAAALRDRSFDLIVCHLALVWNRVDLVLSEFRRLLEPDGVLLFSLFGPDTLTELRQSFPDQAQRCMGGTDLHIVGDALLAAGFVDPVMDAEHLTIRYQSVDTLLSDLRRAGWTNLHPDRPRGLTGRGTFAEMRRRYEQHRVDGQLPATFEIVYGYAVGPAAGRPRRVPGGHEATFTLDELRAQLPRKP